MDGQQNAPLPGPESSIPELTAANRAAFNEGLVDQQVQAGLQQDQAAIDRQEEMARREQEMQDPRNYQIVRTPTGGMRFIDPSGNEVTVRDYARVSGQTPAEVLEQSQDPQDQQFVEDYKNMQTTINALYNEDAGALQQMQSRDPEGFSVLQDYTNQHGNLSDAADAMMEDFMNYYGDYYGREGQEGQLAAPEFAQNTSPSASAREVGTTFPSPQAIQELSESELGQPGEPVPEAARQQGVLRPQDLLGTDPQGEQFQREREQAINELQRRRQEANQPGFIGQGIDFLQSSIGEGIDQLNPFSSDDARKGAASGIGNTALDRDSQNRIANARRGDFTGRSTRQFLSGRG